MKYLSNYDDNVVEILENLYYEIFELEESEDVNNTMKNVVIAGAASGAGWAIGGELFDFFKKKGIKPSKGTAKKYIPFAIAGGVLLGILGTLTNIIKKKKDIKYLLNNEKDPKKKEILKKQLNELSKKEIIQLKKYKQNEEKAKLQTKIKLSKQDKKKLALEIKSGIIQKEKIDILKKSVTNSKK